MHPLLCQISNGHIFATGHPTSTSCLFYRVGLSESVPDGSNGAISGSIESKTAVMT